MNLSEPFIRRPVMTSLVMLSILFFGISSYKGLPVSDLPNVDMPTIEVSVDYPGANPETMANSVATPLEQQFMTIEGIRSIFSNSSLGATSISLQFALDRDIDAASTDVQAAISRAQPNLPSDLPNNPTYQKVNPAATPVLYLALTASNLSQGEFYDYANTFIGQRLSMVDGVAQVTTFGSPYAVRIQIDPQKLAAKEIGLDEVAAAINAENVDLTLGNLYGPNQEYTIDADGQIMNAAGYAEIILKNQDGNLVKIRDVGRTLDSIENDKFFTHYVTEKKDQICIVLAVRRLPGANTIHVVEGINQVLEKLKPQLPKTLEITRIYDQSESIAEGIFDIKLTLFIAFLLVIGIVYFSLGKALNALIPSLTLPLSIIGTFAAMFLSGFSIDILSLLALTLSVGFLIDDAIVVLENIVRHTQMGKPPLEAALTASREISVTVLSMTLCLIAAFVPLVFMGGVIGKLFREFALTLILAVFLSGFLSLTLTPMLASRLIRPYAKREKPRMERLADAVNEKMKKLYEPCLHFAMEHRKTMLLLGTLSIALSLFLFRVVQKDFLPTDDIGFIQGYTVARDGTSPFLMERYHRDLTEIARHDPNIEATLSISSFSNANEGIAFFRLKPFNKRLPMDKVIEELSQKYHTLPGLNVYLSPLPLINLAVGSTVQALYQYSLTSLDAKTLYEFAPKFVSAMKKNASFSQVSSDLRIQQPQWAFHIDREKASNLNVSAAQIERYFSYAYSDNKVSQINADINQYDVILETLPQFYRDPTVLSKLFVRSSTNALVPLSEILVPTETIGPLTVNHVNGLPAVNVSFNPGTNAPLGTVLDALQKLAQEELPVAVQGHLVGTADVFQRSFEHLIFLFVLAFFAIYTVLGILYESFIHPITVMSALPPALFGGLLSLYLFGETLSLYSFVGLILLIGIVLKNGIMMVDFANAAVAKEKKSAREAIIEAALIRFRPIMMTTLSAMMGAVPVALGIGGAMAQTRTSLGICIVGGLLLSQLLTLLLTPVLYYYFERLQEKLKELKK